MTLHYAVDDATIERLWNKFDHKESHWKHLEAASFPHFQRLFRSSPLVIELPFGYVRLESVDVGAYCIAHAAFWDRSVLRNLPKLLEIASLLHTLYSVNYVYAPIPKDNRSLKHLLAMLGFSYRCPVTQVGPDGDHIGELWRLPVGG